MINRRSFLRSAGIAGGALALSPLIKVKTSRAGNSLLLHLPKRDPVDTVLVFDKIR